MLHLVREVGAGAVTRAAADYFAGVGDGERVFGIGIRKHPALINTVIPALRPPPLHAVPQRFVEHGKFHQAEVGPSA